MNTEVRILIVDDNLRMAETLADVVRVKGYGVDTAHSAEKALEKIEAGQFDCVLSDIKMPDVSGVELYRAIKEKKPDLPVVLMTAYSDDKLVRESIEDGVITVLPKPLDINAILGFFSSLRQKHLVAIVDDDPDFCKTLGDILKERGFGVTQFTDPCELLNSLDEDIHVILLDMKLGETNGLDVLKKIKKKDPHIPVILVTGYREEMAESIQKALSIDAYTCLYKPLQIEALIETITEVYHQELGRTLGQRPRKKNRNKG